MKTITEINYRKVADKRLSLEEAIDYCIANKIEYPRFTLQVLTETENGFEVDEINTKTGGVDETFEISIEEHRVYAHEQYIEMAENGNNIETYYVIAFDAGAKGTRYADVNAEIHARITVSNKVKARKISTENVIFITLGVLAVIAIVVNILVFGIHNF